MHIGRILGGVFARLPILLHAMLMAIVLVLVMRLVLFAIPHYALAGAGRQSPEVIAFAVAYLILHGLLVAWAGTVVASRWHRVVMAGDSGFRWWCFPLGRREWGYLGWLAFHVLLVLAVTMAVTLTATALLGEGAVWHRYASPMLLVAVWSLWAGAFGLTLPAAALGERIGGLRGSLKWSRNRYWPSVAQIAVASFIGLVVAVVLIALGNAALEWRANRLAGELIQGEALILGLSLGLVLATSALSFNYGETLGWPDPAAETEPEAGPARLGEAPARDRSA